MQVHTDSDGDKPDMMNTINGWAAIADTKNETIYINLAINFTYCLNGGNNTYLLHMTTTLMQSLFAHHQTERHLLLSTSSNLSATCFKRNTKSCNFMQRFPFP